MELFYFRSTVANFGDELNDYMWPRLMPPGFFDGDPAEMFLGTGSILVDYHPKAAVKHVMGAGYAGYTAPPTIDDGSWVIHFVRGPRTAATLGLSRDMAICDSAILIRALNDLPAPGPACDVAFMPHFESLERGHWTRACKLAGVTLLDPTAPVPDILAQLRGCRMLITEAMHGAIVADALRVPWLPVLPLNPVHHDKWHDWADSLDITLRPKVLRASSVMEVYTSRTGGRGGLRGRAGRIGQSRLLAPVNEILTQRAARHLQSLAKAEPQLSSDAKITTATDRAMEKVRRFLAARGDGPTAPKARNA